MCASSMESDEDGDNRNFLKMTFEILSQHFFSPSVNFSVILQFVDPWTHGPTNIVRLIHTTTNGGIGNIYESRKDIVDM